MEVNKLYPQYQPMPDRRKQDVIVPLERRSGDDRRVPDRVQLDTQLIKELYEVKHKVAQLQKIVEDAGLDTTKNATNTIYSDQFIPTNKNQALDKAMKNTEPPSSTSVMAGVLTVALGGVLGGALLGTTAGVIIALGIGAYMGARALRLALLEQISEDDKNKK